ncbi:MAG: hypothetical protein WC340_17740 [Kiritimatiellia bacterium]
MSKDLLREALIKAKKYIVSHESCCDQEGCTDNPNCGTSVLLKEIDAALMVGAIKGHGYFLFHKAFLKDKEALYAYLANKLANLLQEDVVETYVDAAEKPGAMGKARVRMQVRFSVDDDPEVLPCD